MARQGNTEVLGLPDNGKCTINVEFSQIQRSSVTVNVYLERMPAAHKKPRAGKDALPSNPKEASSTDALSPKQTSKLLFDWERYLSIQQAYSTIHVEKSIDSARAWATFAGQHGWHSRAAMAWVQENIKVTSRKTAQNKASQAREFCRFCISMGAIKTNPLEGVKIANGRRDRSRQWQPFEVAEVRRLIEVAEARESSTDKRRSKNGPLASTFYAFLTLTGLRFGEAKNQLWRDIDMTRMSMTVTADKAQRQDQLPLCPEAISVLKAWKKWSTGERLFPKAPSAHTLRSDMAAACIKAATDGGQKGEWHRFRKTAIAERAAAGADVRNLHHFARHENLQTTLSIYDKAKVDQLRDVAAMMPRLNGFLKRERAGVGLVPEVSPKEICSERFDFPEDLAEDDGVQSVIRPGASKRTQTSRRKLPSPCPAVTEQLGVKHRDGSPRLDVEGDACNGAVGN